ncbi:MAG: hypothetical protein PF693_14305 [Spirochaetia bacterium]|jgi:hypothetical protein|nr:hypothetical protein [Spirochaetia bacterium]
MKIAFLVITVFSLLTLSCSEGFLSDMLRVITDPVVEEPTVFSFEKEETIEISWNTDPGVDKYILYRAEDTLIPIYEILYQGRELSLTDTEVTSEHRYLYKLGKLRGTMLFGPSEPILGVGSNVIQDNLERNNIKENATTLVWDLDANLYYYRSNTGEEIEDYDWYLISVPPRRKAMIVVTQDGLGTGDDSWMNYYLEGHVTEPIVNSNAIPVDNYSYTERTFFFLISPNTSEFIGDPTLGGGGLINYRVSLQSIQSL